MFTGLLTAVVFVPIFGAIVLATLIKGTRNIRLFAAIVAIADLSLAILAFVCYKTSGQTGFALIDQFNWINSPNINVQYQLGIDGISAPLILLTGILGFCAIFASWSVKSRVKEYFVWLLILQASVMGVFTSLDLIMFFIFWELELIPMYFLISIWGSGRKEYSAMKFLVFTILGSVFMLVSIVAIFLSPQINTLDIIKLSEQGISASALIIPASVAFWFFFVAFAVKLPIWPLHTWLPDAHTDAPTAVSVMLAGVLLKMGGYGLIRISVGLFPELAQSYAHIIAILAVIGVLYGALVTLRQTDLKRLIAYSSISHMGLVLLGIASIGIGTNYISPVGLTGAAMQMFTHGTIAGLLFLMVGLIYERTHTRYIPDLGGIASKMPIISVAFVIAGLASLGLPGLSGFAAEILVFLGAFEAFPWHTGLAAFGIVLAAGYILWMIQRVLFGAERSRFAELSDVTVIEAIPVVVLVASTIIVGIYPALITDVFSIGVENITSLVAQIGEIS